MNSAYPPTIADVPASAAKSGYMQRWAAQSSTVASFAVTAKGMGGRLYVPLATASLAGALSAADFTKLGTLIRPISRLNYGPAADHLNGAALTANTFADVFANQNFNVATANAYVLVTVRFSCNILSTTGTHSDGCRAVIDSAGTPINVPLSGDVALVNNYGNLTGGAFLLSTLTAATHTIKLQVICSQTATAFCRANSAPNFEFAYIDIVEISA